MGHFSKGLSKIKPNSNSVKGKKDIACTRASYYSPSSTVIPKERRSTKSKWSFSISKIHSDPNDEFKFGSKLGIKCTINVDGLIMEIPRVIINEIRAHPTHTIGWFCPKLQKAWKLLFPLTPTSVALGYLHLTDPAWGRMIDPWWKFLSNTLGPKEARKLVWDTIPQVSTTSVLCEVIPEENLSMRRMLENQAIATTFMGN